MAALARKAIFHTWCFVYLPTSQIPMLYWERFPTPCFQSTLIETSVDAREEHKTSPELTDIYLEHILRENMHDWSTKPCCLVVWPMSASTGAHCKREVSVEGRCCWQAWVWLLGQHCTELLCGLGRDPMLSSLQSIVPTKWANFCQQMAYLVYPHTAS